MRCPSCGAEMPENAKFCSQCGRSLVGVPAFPAPPSTPSRLRTAKWWGLGVGVLLLLAIAFVAGTRSKLFTQLQVQRPEAPSVLEAQPPKLDAPSVLEAQPPKLEAPSVVAADAPNQLPKHIIDWLEHLRRIEQRRQRMERNIAPVMSMLVQAMAARAAAMSGVAQGDIEKAEADYQREREKLRQSYQQRQREWAQLLRDFQSVPPPPECRVLADTYYAGLSQYITTIRQIEQDLVEEDLGGLTGLLGSAQSELDVRFARADEELTRVCEQYGIPKSFSIGAQGSELFRALSGGLGL